MQPLNPLPAATTSLNTLNAAEFAQVKILYESCSNISNTLIEAWAGLFNVSVQSMKTAVHLLHSGSQAILPTPSMTTSPKILFQSPHQQGEGEEEAVVRTLRQHNPSDILVSPDCERDDGSTSIQVCPSFFSLTVPLMNVVCSIFGGHRATDSDRASNEPSS